MTEAEKERAAVVAWLRREASGFREWGSYSVAIALDDVADEIALGDHTKEG